MSIDLTDELEVKTKKGKLAAAKQIFLEGDKETVQQIGDKTHQLEEAIKDITATGGASTANAVSYSNEISGMTAVTAQGAIDELAAKNKTQDSSISTKAEKDDVQASVSELKAKNTSQDAEIAKKANSADVASQMQTEQTRVNAELDKKFNKEDIAQELGENETKVASLKCVKSAIDETNTKVSDLSQNVYNLVEDMYSLSIPTKLLSYSGNNYYYFNNVAETPRKVDAIWVYSYIKKLKIGFKVIEVKNNTVKDITDLGTFTGEGEICVFKIPYTILSKGQTICVYTPSGYQDNIGISFTENSSPSNKVYNYNTDTKVLSRWKGGTEFLYKVGSYLDFIKDAKLVKISTNKDNFPENVNDAVLQLNDAVLQLNDQHKIKTAKISNLGTINISVDFSTYKVTCFSGYYILSTKDRVETFKLEEDKETDFYKYTDTADYQIQTHYLCWDIDERVAYMVNSTKYKVFQKEHTKFYLLGFGTLGNDFFTTTSFLYNGKEINANNYKLKEIIEKNEDNIRKVLSALNFIEYGKLKYISENGKVVTKLTLSQGLYYCKITSKNGIRSSEIHVGIIESGVWDSEINKVAKGATSLEYLFDVPYLKKGKNLYTLCKDDDFNVEISQIASVNMQSLNNILKIEKDSMSFSLTDGKLLKMFDVNDGDVYEIIAESTDGTALQEITIGTLKDSVWQTSLTIKNATALYGNIIIPPNEGGLPLYGFSKGGKCYVSIVKKKSKILSELQKSIDDINGSIGDINKSMEEKNVYPHKLFNLTSASKETDYLLLGNFAKTDNYFSNTNFSKNSRLILNKCYAIDTRTVSFDFVPTKNSIAVCGYTPYNVTEEAGYGQTFFGVDFGNKKIIGYKSQSFEEFTSYSFNENNYIGNKYRFTIRCINTRHIHITLERLTPIYNKVWELELEEPSNSTNPWWGLCWDRPTIFSLNNSIKVKSIRVWYYSASKDRLNLYITGDSITEGDGTVGAANIWSRRICKEVENSLQAGRRAEQISSQSFDVNSSMSRLISEVSVIKPKTVMITHGANLGLTQENANRTIEYLQNLGIESIYFNHCWRWKSAFEQLHPDKYEEYQNIYETCEKKYNISTVRFDLATSINGNIENGTDESLYHDNVHLNINGNNASYKQVHIDCPELFKL